MNKIQLIDNVISVYDESKYDPLSAAWHEYILTTDVPIGIDLWLVTARNLPHGYSFCFTEEQANRTIDIVNIVDETKVFKTQIYDENIVANSYLLSDGDWIDPMVCILTETGLMNDTYDIPLESLYREYKLVVPLRYTIQFNIKTIHQIGSIYREI